MEKSKLRLNVTLKHPKGDIVEGSIYHWDEDLGLYVHRDPKTGIPNASINKAAVAAFGKMFEYVD